ncbi:tRNA (adenosine(37)-N6)-dimethylallyltransferase MiaA, partial [Buchnera aphidicola]|nr:tRNA (adenosine(37)-N6)-dimethylallyltransferase MiaA [Buchnera aphidicola]
HFTLLKHPHRLLNIKDPRESYSAAEFQKNALKEIKDIIKIGKIPCLVGGTMFYYYVLLNGLSDLPKSDVNIRQYILKKNNYMGYLHEKLRSIDPFSANRIHKNDSQRLLRALEIFYISGKTLTELTKNNNYTFPYTVFPFFIIPPNKDWLYD